MVKWQDRYAVITCRGNARQDIKKDDKYLTAEQVLFIHSRFNAGSSN